MVSTHNELDCRYTDWRPNLLHGVSTAVYVGSRTVGSLLYGELCSQIVVTGDARKTYQQI